MTTATDAHADARAVTGQALVDHVEHFRHRALQDALADATAAYWQRRAQQLLDARPRAGDSHGLATPADLRRRYDELTQAALACTRRAEVSLLGGEVW